MIYKNITYNLFQSTEGTKVYYLQSPQLTPNQIFKKNGCIFALWGKKTWTLNYFKKKFEPNANFLDNFAKLSNHKFEKKTPGPKPHGHNFFCWVLKIIYKQFFFHNSLQNLTTKWKIRPRWYKPAKLVCSFRRTTNSFSAIVMTHLELHKTISRTSNLKLTGKYTLLVKRPGKYTWLVRRHCHTAGS